MNIGAVALVNRYLLMSQLKMNNNLVRLLINISKVETIYNRNETNIFRAILFVIIYTLAFSIKKVLSYINLSSLLQYLLL